MKTGLILSEKRPDGLFSSFIALCEKCNEESEVYNINDVVHFSVAYQTRYAAKMAAKSFAVINGISTLNKGIFRVE